MSPPRTFFAILVVGLALPLGIAHASSLATSSIQLRDLRPGYTIGYARFRTPEQVVAGRALSVRDLTGRGWVSHYEAYFGWGSNSQVAVGDALDQFRSSQGAHWFLTFRLSHLATGYSTISMPRVGDESSGISNGSYLGILFRQGVDVADVYVTSQVPAPRRSLLALAHLVDQRLRGGKSSTQQPPSPPAGGALRVRAWVSPSIMSYDAYPTLYALTTSGASCSAEVIYTTGRHPVSFAGSAQTAGSNRMVSWSWHEETKGTGGAATVLCSYRGQTKSATASFTVT